MERCVAVIIKNNDKFLVAQRTDTNEWASPGGHMMPGESPRQAIIRETQEEVNTGIINPIMIGQIDNPDKQEYYFIAEDYSTEPRADGKEMKKAIWVNREELNNMNLYPPFEKFLEIYDNIGSGNEVVISDEIGTTDYNSATDKKKYKWVGDLNKTVYIKNGGVRKAIRREINSDETVDEFTVKDFYKLNTYRKNKGMAELINFERVKTKMDKIFLSEDNAGNSTTTQPASSVDTPKEAFWKRAKEQTYGVELEMLNMTTSKARKILDNLGLTEKGWKAVYDGSLGSDGAEIVTPPLKYEDMKDLEKVIQKCNEAGAISGASTNAGLHIHIGAGEWDKKKMKTINPTISPESMRSLVNIMNRYEKLLMKGVGVDKRQVGTYTKETNKQTLSELNSTTNLTYDKIQNAYYQLSSPYNQWAKDRYHALNLDPFYNKNGKGHGTVEFRYGQFGDNDKDKKMDFNHLKPQIDMVLALTQYAKDNPDIKDLKKLEIKRDYDEKNDSQEKIAERNQTRYGLMSKLLDDLNITGDNMEETRKYWLRKFKF